MLVDMVSQRVSTSCDRLSFCHTYCHAENFPCLTLFRVYVFNFHNGQWLIVYCRQQTNIFSSVVPSSYVTIRLERLFPFCSELSGGFRDRDGFSKIVQSCSLNSIGLQRNQKKANLSNAICCFVYIIKIVTFLYRIDIHSSPAQLDSIC